MDDIMKEYDSLNSVPQEQDEHAQLMQEFDQLHSPNVSEEPKSEISHSDYDPGAFTAAALSFSEGAMGGLAGEFVGGVAGGAEWALNSEDHSFADFSALYKKNRDTYDSVRIAGEEKYPILALGAEIGGGVASAALLGAAGLVGNSIKAGATMGAVSGFGKSEGFDPLAIAGGAALGGATQGVANKIFGTSGTTAASKVEKLTVDETQAILNGFNIIPKGEYSITNQAVKASNALSRRGDISLAQWAQEIKKLPDGKMIFEVGDNFKTVADKLEKSIGTVGGEIGTVLGQLDQAIAVAPDKGVNLFNVINRVQNDVMGQLSDISPSAQKKVVGILQRFQGRTHLGFNEAQAVRSELSKTIDFAKNSLNNADSLKHTVNGIFREEMINSARAVNSELADSFVAQSRQYGNLKLASDLLKEPAIGAELTHLGAMQGKLLNAGRRTVVATMLNSKSGTLGAVVEGFKAIISSPPAGLAGKRLASVAKLKDAFAKEPGKYNELATKVLMSASRTHEQFAAALGHAESVVDLNQFPVERNTQDLTMKLPQVLNVINEQSPAVGNQLLKAVQSGNEAEIGSIMSNLGRLAASQGIMARGTGWNGKAATAQDIADWEGQIRNSPQNHTTKMRQLEQLRKNGTGPVFEQKTDYIRQVVNSKRSKNGKKETRL